MKVYNPLDTDPLGCKVHSLWLSNCRISLYFSSLFPNTVSTTAMDDSVSINAFLVTYQLPSFSYLFTTLLSPPPSPHSHSLPPPSSPLPLTPFSFRLFTLLQYFAPFLFTPISPPPPPSPSPPPFQSYFFVFFESFCTKEYVYSSSLLFPRFFPYN